MSFLSTDNSYRISSAFTTYMHICLLRATLFGYMPHGGAFTQQFTTTGEVTSQYDPVEAYLPDPNSACNMIQQAMIRVWVEDRTVRVSTLLGHGGRPNGGWSSKAHPRHERRIQL
jgi:hypothetical protein